MKTNFEIQKDSCYHQIKARFGRQFFYKQTNKQYFDFRAALSSILPQAEFDGRSTFTRAELASWRRDQTARRNITVIGRFD